MDRCLDLENRADRLGNGNRNGERNGRQICTIANLWSSSILSARQHNKKPDLTAATKFSVKDPLVDKQMRLRSNATASCIGKPWPALSAMVAPLASSWISTVKDEIPRVMGIVPLKRYQVKLAKLPPPVVSSELKVLKVQ